MLSFELLMRQLRQRLKTNLSPNPPGPYPHIAESLVPAAAQLNTQQPASGAGRQNLLDKARHIREDQERHGSRLTGKTLATLLGISDGYARRLLREIDSEPALTT